MRIIWSPAAWADRGRHLDFLEAEYPSAALHVIAALDAAAASLATFPQRGRPGLVTGTRERVAVPPYVIVFQVDAATDAAVVLRVWHAAQDR